MKMFMYFLLAILGIAVTCEANSVQEAASSSLGMQDHASLQVTSSYTPKRNLRQSTGHEALDSSSNNNNHMYRQLEYLDFKTELGPEEVSFLIIVAVILFLLCCCCSGGRRSRRRSGGSCGLCDILACVCIWDICCDRADPTDFCLV
jgi:hypothetical protein